MHTYAIGYGKDENASVLVILVKECEHFGHRGNLQSKFDRAFESFATWCKTTRKHTSITGFSKKEFKMSGTLECIYFVLHVSYS